MRTMLAVVLCVSTLLSACAPKPTEQTGSLRQRFIGSTPEVRLEVLDSEGDGPPLVFLAGAFATAHVFDTFAPRFISAFRVIAITRRGFGASSRPATGYSVDTLSADIIAVLDSLRIQRAAFVAHSFGGAELSFLATRYPHRVARLIYLDSAFDFPSLYAFPGWWNPRPQPPPMTSADSSSPEAVAAYAARVLRLPLPVTDIKAKMHFDSAGRLVQADDYSSLQPLMVNGVAPLGSSVINAQVLAIYAEPRGPDELFPNLTELAPAEQEKGRSYWPIWQAAMIAQRRRFAEFAPHAQIVLVPGAHHFVYLSHPDKVEKDIHSFLRPFAEEWIGNRRGRDAPPT